MRWLKHLTAAHQDVAISEILEEFGPEGYGIYWLILEHLAVTVEKDSLAIPSACHSVVRWSQICHCSARVFRKFTERAADLKLIESRSAADLKQFASRSPADRLHIGVPKLLKYRDEYSKKSRYSPDKVPSRVDRDRDREHITPDCAVSGAVSGLQKPTENQPAASPQNGRPRQLTAAQQIAATMEQIEREREARKNAN
jgi:hypothetical protein